MQHVSAMQQQEDIFSHLALEPLALCLPVVDVLRLARVSRAWRERLGRRLLTEPLSIECGTEQRRASAVAWLTRNLQRTRDLELKGWRAPVPPDLLTRAAANSLVRLSFSGPTCSAPQLPSLAACTALMELRIDDCNGVTELPPLDALSQLTSLQVSYCYQLTQLPTSLSSCTALRELRIDDCNGVTELPPLDALSQLTSLQVSYCFQLTQLPASLGSCTALQELRIYGNRELSSLPSSLASCTALKALSIGRENDENYNCFVLPQTLLPALTRLTELILYDCNMETLSFNTCPQLRMLHVGHCDVTASQLDTLTACTRLSELYVSMCCRDQDGAGFLGAPLPPLLSLKELSINAYTDGSRFPSLAGLTRLTRLHASFCEIEPFQLAPISGLTSLVHLRIAYCSSLFELPSLAACEQLQSLDVEGCIHLVALPPDLSGCTRLESLCCDGCEGLQSLPDLSSCIAEALKEVSFVGCTALLEAPGFDEWLERLRGQGVAVSLGDDADAYEQNSIKFIKSLVMMLSGETGQGE